MWTLPRCKACKSITKNKSSPPKKLYTRPARRLRRHRTASAACVATLSRLRWRHAGRCPCRMPVAPAGCRQVSCAGLLPEGRRRGFQPVCRRHHHLACRVYRHCLSVMLGRTFRIGGTSCARRRFVRAWFGFMPLGHADDLVSDGLSGCVRRSSGRYSQRLLCAKSAQAGAAVSDGIASNWSLAGVFCSSRVELVRCCAWARFGVQHPNPAARTRRHHASIRSGAALCRSLLAQYQPDCPIRRAHRARISVWTGRAGRVATCPPPKPLSDDIVAEAAVRSFEVQHQTTAAVATAAQARLQSCAAPVLGSSSAYCGRASRRLRTHRAENWQTWRQQQILACTAHVRLVFRWHRTGRKPPLNSNQQQTTAHSRQEQ